MKLWWQEDHRGVTFPSPTLHLTRSSIWAMQSRHFFQFCSLCWVLAAHVITWHKHSKQGHNMNLHEFICVSVVYSTNVLGDFPMCQELYWAL